jgi:hypothetical protein
MSNIKIKNNENALNIWRYCMNCMYMAFGNNYALELQDPDNPNPETKRIWLIYQQLYKELNYNDLVIKFVFEQFCKTQSYQNFTLANLLAHVPKVYNNKLELLSKVSESDIVGIYEISTNKRLFCEKRHLGILSYGYEQKKLLQPIYGGNKNDKFIALLFGLFKEAETKEKDFIEYAKDLQLLLNDFNVKADAVELLTIYLNSLTGAECNVVTGLMQIHRAKGWHYD